MKQLWEGLFKNDVFFFLKFLDCDNRVYLFKEEIGGILFTVSEYSRHFLSLYKWRSCEVDLNSSWFLGCNGVKLQDSQYLREMEPLFTFSRTVSGLRQFWIQVRGLIRFKGRLTT